MQKTKQYWLAKFTAIKAAIVIMAFAVAPPSQAEAYVGLAIGQADGTLAYNEKTTSFELVGGYAFSENFALEAGYLNLGSVNFEDGEVSVDGLKGEVVASLPLMATMSVFAKMGFYSWTTTYTESSRYSRYEEELNNDINLMYGVGINFAVADNFDVVIDYQNVDFDLDRDGATNLSMGLRFYFR